jgi:hypothetical protein
LNNVACEQLAGELSVTLKVSENRVLRRIFGPKRDEVTGEWRKLHNEEIHDLYCSPSIIRIIKSWRIGWAGHVARMGERRNTYRLLVGKPLWILARWDGVMWTGLVWLWVVTGGELGNYRVASRVVFSFT